MFLYPITTRVVLSSTIPGGLRGSGPLVVICVVPRFLCEPTVVVSPSL